MHTSYDQLSLASYFVKSRFNQQDLSKGATCFFVKRKGELFLVTNWHVVSGRNFETKSHLDPSLGEPNNLLVMLHKNQETVELEEFSIALFDENGKPAWYEHRTFNSDVDVVAIKVTLPENLIAFTVEEFIEPFNDQTTPRVKSDVFVIGYPFGLTAGEIFPIWKRASIASEPCIDIKGLPIIYVDTATREGMSGSPVVLYEKRAIAIFDEAKGQSNNYMAFVGIYSGRIGAGDELKAQLGIVWKGSVLTGIIPLATSSAEDTLSNLP